MCAWLQYHFLSMDVGVIDGHRVDWSLYHKQMILNAVLWIVILIIILIICNRHAILLEKFEKLISCGFSVMLMISLITSMIQNKDTLFTSASETAYLSDMGEFEVSQNGRNIVIFILDMYDETYFREILESGYDLSSFDGFTYYNNHTGSYSTTKYSIPLLLTGELSFNQQAFPDWLDSFDYKDIYPDALIEADWNLYYYMDSISGMVPHKCYESASNLRSAKAGIPNKKHFLYELYRLVGCRCLPDFLKPVIWMDGTEFKDIQGFEDDYQASSDDNLKFYDHIDGQGEVTAVSDLQDSVKYIYLYGAHHPYTMNEDLERIDIAFGEEAAVSCAKGLIKIIGTYLEQLKSIGCYDNTAVVITADHGYYLEGVRSAPILLIKPMNTHGGLAVNNAPVSQCDFGATLLNLAGLDNYDRYGTSVFDICEGTQRERFFYQYSFSEDEIDGNRRLIEYSIPSDDNLYSDYRLTDNEYMVDGTLIPHSSFCKTCQDSRDESDLYTPYQVYHEPTDSYPVPSIDRQ